MSEEPTDVEPVADADPASQSAETAESTSTAVAVAEDPGALERAAKAERTELRKDRLWLPFLIPVGAILVVALFAINISRLFLAASQNSKDPAVIVGILLTLGVLGGATFVAAVPKLRTSSLMITMMVVTGVILLSGSLTLGAAENKVVVSAEPSGPAIFSLDVQASNFQFQKTEFEVPPGVVEIKYVSNEGSHTLAFGDPQFSYVALSQPGGKNAAKITAVAGQKYTIYCTIPGHRAAGMQATITVNPNVKPGAPAAGTATPTTTLPGKTTPTSNPGNSQTDSSQQSNTSSSGN